MHLFDNDHVEAALAAWEHLVARRERNPPEINRLFDSVGGTATARQLCIWVGVKLDKAYRHLDDPDKELEPFDWEFVPGVLDQLNNPFTATQDAYDLAARHWLDDVKVSHTLPPKEEA